MKFYFHKLVLWLSNNEKRELLFEPNKVKEPLINSHREI
jgi:hypothetical protein